MAMNAPSRGYSNPRVHYTRGTSPSGEYVAGSMPKLPSLILEKTLGALVFGHDHEGAVPTETRPRWCVRTTTLNLQETIEVTGFNRPFKNCIGKYYQISKTQAC